MVGRARGLRIVFAAAALAVATVLASCAATQKSVGGWFGAATPTPTAKAAPVAQAPRAYYARVEGLKVRSEPSASSKVVGTLSLHERVMRSRVERGFALVESTKSGVKGWVDNAQLTWRLPTAPAAVAPTPGEAQPEEAQPEQVQPEEAQPEESVPPEVEETEVPAAPQPTAAVEPSPATTPVPAVSPSTAPTPGRVGPSIFNPY